MKRSIRFARALALSCAAVSCAGKVVEPAEADGAVDSGEPDAKASGHCARSFYDAGVGLECAAGGACVWDVTSGMPACRFDAIAPEPCGPIGCGSACSCSSAGLCLCSGPVEGPLPPPDLASV